MIVQLGFPHWLTISQLRDICEQRAQVTVSDAALEKVEASRTVLEQYTLDRLPVYGVNTQFGDDAYRVVIEGDYEKYVLSVAHRQNDVMRALGCGVGDVHSPEICRATIALRVHLLAQGCSGVRRILVERLAKLLAADVIPYFYKFGSVGASGDLVPLSAIARLTMGEGEVRFQGEQCTAAEALRRVGLLPDPLTMKEGLAIVNGTSFMTAIAALAVSRLCWLLPLSIAAAATSVEAMLGMDSPYEPFVHEGKHHSGQVRVASFVRKCWENSSLIRSLDTLRQEWRTMILGSGRAEQENVQDYYSLRGIAHGFGPFYDDLERAVEWVENEMNSLNDNPLIDSDHQRIHSSANFLGDYIAVICDHLRSDVAKSGTWLHALLGNLVNPRKNRGLPSCLVRDPDSTTGFKTVQLLMASLVIENRGRCVPVSSVMLPTEGDNQDMVSLGTHSATQLMEVVDNFQLIVAIMLVSVAQAIELRGIDKASDGGRAIVHFVRQSCLFLDRDRALRDEILEVSRRLRQCELATPWFTM
ncbi:HAL/PAL/TAL family ammonia-lyase [Methylobacterium oryzisoli]|uniref:HAL/PAL/TAL family ammonia-lyase n=1 Tax=Methylobacterium oryzisoli TaxID=3385502 RepID=UPI0038917898